MTYVKCTSTSIIVPEFPLFTRLLYMYYLFLSVQVVNTHSSAFHSCKWIMYIAIFFYLQFSFALNFMCIYGIRNPFRGCWGFVCYRKWRDYHLWFWRNFFYLIGINTCINCCLYCVTWRGERFTISSSHNLKI